MRSFERGVLTQRLRNQRLAGPTCRTPAQVVKSLAAVQAQDYPGARWAVGQRMTNPSDAAVRQALDDGRILRTHVLRPTWHLVTPEDIRWMLALTAPRVKAACAFYHRQAGLTPEVFAKSHAVIERALQGGGYLTRSELGADLAAAGIPAKGTTLAHLMLQAELDAIVCSGPWRGAQSTYALLAERAPRSRMLTREEGLGELTRRYFQSHGPAMIADFVWWSGLTVRDAREGLAMAASSLERMTLDDREYWHAPAQSTTARAADAAYLLPNFDEYTVAYRDRSLIVPRAALHAGAVSPTSVEALGSIIVIGGLIAGTWKRCSKPGVVLVEARTRRLSDRETTRLTRAAHQYGRFLGTGVELVATVQDRAAG